MGIYSHFLDDANRRYPTRDAPHGDQTRWMGSGRFGEDLEISFQGTVHRTTISYFQKPLSLLIVQRAREPNHPFQDLELPVLFGLAILTVLQVLATV